MPQLQPRKVSLGDGGHTEVPLRFALRLRLHLDTTRLTVAQAAHESGISPERMEDILSGKNHPLAADVLRIMYGLGIYFKPDDFTERGLSI